jgi:hypothetical protein
MSYPPEWRLALRNGGSNTLRPGGLPAAPPRIGSRHTDCLVSGEIAGPGFRNRGTRLQLGA